MEVLAVTPGSLAEKAGIEPGSRILSVNGQKVRDFLDLNLWLGEEVLELSVEPANVRGESRTVRILRGYGQELGLQFPEARIRRCGNDCPFCFVDQLPQGLRKNLYIRDDDYRFSFLYGHFITLTNLKEHEFERIIEQNLSPLYVSVHALDPVARERMLKSKRAGEIRARLEQLLAGGIELHTQVVVVPGINDGRILEETVFGLAEYHPGVRSVSVVPVGLTAHRDDLPEVQTLTRVQARDIARCVRRYGRAMRRKLGEEFCYVADELVILAALPIPPASYYGDFEQRENGVGLVRSTLLHFAGAVPRGQMLREQGIGRVWMLTGESFAPVLRKELPSLESRLPEIELRVLEIRNCLFGRPVTCGGLLGGKDLLDAAKSKVRPGDLVLVPDEAVNENGLFLDDLTPEILSRELGVPVEHSWDPILGSGSPDLEDAFIAGPYDQPPVEAGAES